MGKRVASLSLVLASALAAMIILLVIFSSPVSAGDVCVDPSGGGCQTTIQDAIDVALPGDLIKVLAATYNENLEIDKNLTLLGGFDDDDFSDAKRTPRTSIVDGGGTGSVIRIIDGADVTVDGFTIRGGDATANRGEGGGIYIQEATAAIIDNLIEGNIGSSDPSTPGKGGGIFVITGTSPVLISNNTISANVAFQAKIPDNGLFGNGGGIRVDISSSALISHNEILSNVAVNIGVPANVIGGGGGLGGFSPDGHITIQNNQIKGNIANNLQGVAYGGGIDLFNVAQVKVTGNDIIKNTGSFSATSSNGGGINVSDANSAIISDNWVAENTAAVEGKRAHGGGIFLGNIKDVILTNNWVLSNTAGITLTGSELFGGGGGINIWGGDVSGDKVLVENNHVNGNIAARSMTDLASGSASSVNGGGLTLYKIANTRIHNNEFRSNVGVDKMALAGSGWLGGASGGGLQFDQSDAVTVSDNLIQDNITVLNQEASGGSSAAQGGGISLHEVKYALLIDNTISGNTSTADGSIASDTGAGLFPNGGGIFAGCFNLSSCNLSIEGNQIANNTAAGTIVGTGSDVNTGAFGGAMNFVEGMEVTMHQNHILDNKTITAGFGSSSIDIWKSSLTSINDVVAGNTGGMALGTDGDSVSLEVVNGTFYDNGDVAIDVHTTSATAQIWNTIIDDHDEGLRQGNGGSLTSDFNLLHNNISNYAGGISPGANDINSGDTDPDFVDPAADDFHLLAGSPAIDTGNNVVAPPVDFEDGTRPVDGDFDGQAVVDIGADEYGYVVYLPVVLK